MVGAEGKDVAHIGLTLVTRSPRLKSPSVLQHSQHDPLQDHLTRRGHTRATHDANAAFGTSVLCTLSGVHSALSAQ